MRELSMQEYGEFLYDMGVILTGKGRIDQARVLLTQAYVAATLAKDSFRKRTIKNSSITCGVELEQAVEVLRENIPQALKNFNASTESFGIEAGFTKARNDLVGKIIRDITSGKLELSLESVVHTRVYTMLNDPIYN